MDAVGEIHIYTEQKIVKQFTTHFLLYLSERKSADRHCVDILSQLDGLLSCAGQLMQTNVYRKKDTE